MIQEPPWDVIRLHPIPTPTVFPVGPANVYFYPGPPAILFDAGTNTEEAFQALCDGLTRLGVNLADIENVVLTHHHLDHVGLVGRIKASSGARVFAHESVPAQLPFLFNAQQIQQQLRKVLLELGAPVSNVDALVEERMKYHWLYEPPQIDEVVQDGSTIGPFEVHFRPGHSPTDTVFVHAGQRWAVTGDHLIHKVTPSPLLRRYDDNGQREKSLVQYYESLMRTRELSITGCFAGHGSPFTDHRHAVDTTLQHIQKRCARLLKLLSPQGLTPYEMTSHLFPRMADVMLYYCLSTTTGHLELLETQGLVFTERRDGVTRYFPVSPSA